MKKLLWLRIFKIFFYYLIFSSLLNIAYALPFSIVPKAGTTLPTSVRSGGTVFAYYTVTNNTSITRTGNHVTYLPPNVSQITEGGTYADTCSGLFNLTSQGSCTLQLAVRGAVDAADPDPHHHLFVCFPGNLVCAGTQSPLNVTVTSQLVSLQISPNSASLVPGGTQQFTALGETADGVIADMTSSVTWKSSNTSVATVNSNGLVTGVSTGTTNITAESDSITSNAAIVTVAPVLVSIAITPTSATIELGNTQQFTATGTYSDGSSSTITNTVSWNSSNTSVATINSSGLATGVSPGSSNITATSGSVTSNTAVLTVRQVYAYVTNGTPTNSVLKCPIQVGGHFGTCIAATFGTGDFWGISINSAGTFAYVAPNNFGNSVNLCPIVADGGFGICSSTGSSGTPGLTGPTGITINPAQTFAYITYFNLSSATNITRCAINSTTGVLSSCVSTGNSQAAIRETAINNAGTTIYIVANSTRVTRCSINSITGLLSSCLSTGEAVFTNPTGIALNPAGTFAYVSNGTGNQVFKCTVDGTTGLLSGCAAMAPTGSGTPFNSPYGIAFNNAGTLAYVVNNGATTVSQCTIDPVTNNFDVCTSTGNGFSNAHDIALY